MPFLKVIIANFYVHLISHFALIQGDSNRGNISEEPIHLPLQVLANRIIISRIRYHPLTIKTCNQMPQQLLKHLITAILSTQSRLFTKDLFQ